MGVSRPGSKSCIYETAESGEVVLGSRAVPVASERELREEK